MRPQVGQLMTSGPRSRKPSAARILHALLALTTTIGPLRYPPDSRALALLADLVLADRTEYQPGDIVQPLDLGWQDLVTTSPNAAGEGAVQCLLSKKARGNVQEIAARIRFVELETSEAFQDRFVAALRFPDPLLGERCSQGQARETSR